MRAVILSFILFAVVAVSGAGIYAATASSAYQTTDGYGISRFSR